MSTEMPPTRYRVIERGRRLIVVDTATGARAGAALEPEAMARGTSLKRAAAQVAAPPPPAPPPVPPASMPGDAADGFTTASWYDAKGPRRIRMNFAVRGQLRTAARTLVVFALFMAFMTAFFWPWFPIVAVAVLAPKKTRDRLRGGVAGFLDSIDPDGGQAG